MAAAKINKACVWNAGLLCAKSSLHFYFVLKAETIGHACLSLRLKFYLDV